MARGEHSKPRDQGPGLAIFGVFVACCIGALTMVATTRGCTGCMPRWGGGAPIATEPFPGAQLALGELGWRDASRGRPSWAAPSTPDAAAAEAALVRELDARGYVEVHRDPAPRALPFDLDAAPLEGACGVIAIVGSGTAVLGALEDRAQGTVRVPDPSVVSIATCAPATLRATGIGSASAIWLALPGITPEDVAALGVPADVALAHHEAEVILHAHGLEPADAIAEQAFGPGTTFVVPPAHAAATGCTAYVGIVRGAGRAETSGTYGMLGRDYAVDRAMFGAVSCAGASSTSTAIQDPEHDGFTVTWRAYGTSGAGPRRAPAGGTLVPTIGEARAVPLADLPAPPSIPAAVPRSPAP